MSSMKALKIKERITILIMAIICTLGIQSWAHDKNKDIDAIRACLSSNIAHDNNGEPLPFFGSSTSSHQVEGFNNNNTHYLLEKSKNTHYAHIEQEAGIACNQRNQFKKDVALMAKSGLSWYRFSVEWAKVEPQQGVWNNEAINYYRELVQELHNHKIEPIVNLHHYTDPIWLALEGGFAVEKTVKRFANFAAKMALELPEVTYWSTFNSPAGYTSRMYVTGSGAPTDLRFVGSKTIKKYHYMVENDGLNAANEMLSHAIVDHCPPKKNITGAAHTLCNVMAAHVAAYYAIKAVNDDNQIGILQNIHQLDPVYSWDGLAYLACYINEELNHRSIHRLFTQGIFRAFIPVPWIGCWISKRICGAQGALDWVGLNYYSNRKMIGTKPHRDPEDIPTDNPNYISYPEGIYRALHQLYNEVAKPLNIPILVTENGIATDDDQLREQFILEYGKQICHAIEDGIPVKAWCIWSFLDNYEWGSFSKHYGLVHVDRKTLKRTPKPALTLLQTLSKAPLGIL